MKNHTEQATALLILLTFSVFFLSLLLSNYHDWDFFLSSAEVDRRSWVLDRQPPIWSYQLCGGVTRIGDPQSFGLSPLFLPVLLLGSFWGSKITVFLCSLLGLVFLQKILRLIADLKGKTRIEVPSVFLYGMGTLALFNNAFLWRSYVGHLSFAILFPIGIGIWYYTLKGYFRGLRWHEFLVGVLLTWGLYSGGLYQTLIFFVLPMYLGWILFILARHICLQWQGERGHHHLQMIFHSLAFHMVGFGISFYKILGVWEYQSVFPRKLPLYHEIRNIFDVFFSHTVPTFLYDFIIPILSFEPWVVWEYSAFSLTTIFFLVFGSLFIRRLLRGRIALPSSDASLIVRFPIDIFLIIAFSVFLLFSFGNFAPFSPFALLNALLENSVRGPSRFYMGASLLMAVFLFLLLLTEKSWMRLFMGKLLVPSLALLNLNFLAFYPALNIPHFLRVLSYENVSSAPMHHMVSTNYSRHIPDDVPQYPIPMSMMFPPENYSRLLRGEGVLDCYMVLRYPSVLPAVEGKFTLVDPAINSPSESCMQGSTFTQNDLFIDPDCPPVTCLNIQSPNRYRRNEHIFFHEEHRKYCWQQNNT